MQVDPVLKDRARAMRRRMTEPEMRLWLQLRDRRFQDVKFSRQVVIGPFIADFCARTEKLIVELDGDTHTDPVRDSRRTSRLEQMGYRMIRFTNGDVMANMEGVLRILASALAAAPHPTLSPEGRGLSRSAPART